MNESWEYFEEEDDGKSETLKFVRDFQCDFCNDRYDAVQEYKDKKNKNKRVLVCLNCYKKRVKEEFLEKRKGSGSVITASILLSAIVFSRSRQSP